MYVVPFEERGHAIARLVDGGSVMNDPQSETTAYPRWMIEWFRLGCIATVCGLPLLLVDALVGSLFMAIGTSSIALSLLAGEDHVRR